jgi:hypothetical protein
VITTAPRELARLRQQRRRDRVREGRRVVLLEVDEVLVEDALIAGGFLRETAADNYQAFAAALAQAVQTWAEEQIAGALVDEISRA